MSFWQYICLIIMYNKGTSRPCSVSAFDIASPISHIQDKMSERRIFYTCVRCFLNISFPIQDVSGDRRSAGLREPGLVQQLLQMREWDSHCRGFRFKSNKIIKAIHKIKIMNMMMITIMLRNVRTVCSSIQCLR